MSFLTEDLIEAVKRRAYIPISQSTEDSDSLIERLTDDMMLQIVPIIEAVKENFFLESVRVPITASKSRYKIPARASGTALKDIWLIDSSGNRLRTVPRTDVHSMSKFQSPGNSVIDCLLRGNEVMLFPTPSATTGYLEFWFYLRPNRLIATTSCGGITAIDSSSDPVTFTVDTDLTGSLSVGDLIDFVSASGPFELNAYDVPIVAISATQIQVAQSYLTDETGTVKQVVGDYICPAKYSNMALIPQEFYPVLAQATAVSVLESMGDLNKKQAAEATYQKLIAAAVKLITNRIEGEPEVIRNQNGIVSSIGDVVYGYQTVWK